MMTLCKPACSASLVGALTLLGMATLILGLVVVVPWLAHASWHAYCDLVLPVEPASGPGGVT